MYKIKTINMLRRVKKKRKREKKINLFDREKKRENMMNKLNSFNIYIYIHILKHIYTYIHIERYRSICF